MSLCEDWCSPPGQPVSPPTHAVSTHLKMGWDAHRDHLILMDKERSRSTDGDGLGH